MAVDPKAVKFHTLGNKLLEEQKFNEAIANYEKALAIESEYAAAYYHMAEAYEAKKLDDESSEYYLKAMELNASYAMIHIDSGLDTLLSGPLGKAVSIYKKQKGLDKGGKGISAPIAGSPVAEATGPAIEKEKPRGKVGLSPRRIVLRTDEEEISTPASSTDYITVELLGHNDIPVAEGKVVFSLRNEPALDDAYLGRDEAAMDSDERLKVIEQTTDSEGLATVYMKRSRIAGKNVLEISAEGVSPVVFTDNTHSSDVAEILIFPEDQSFTTAQEVKFTFKAFDGFGNIVPGLDLEIAMLGKARDKWNVIDNVAARTDENGIYEKAFQMPTSGNMPCRIEVTHKNTKFVVEKSFKVIPGTAGSMMFIPSGGKVKSSSKFTLKLRLMDEFDNPIEGLPVKIVLKEASDGEWKLEEQSSDNTGSDGSVSVGIVPPEEAGAKAVFTARTDCIAEELILEADFETEESGEKETNTIEADPLDLDLDMESPDRASISFEPESTIDEDAVSDTISDIQIGEGDLSGLPDIPLDEDVSGSADAVPYEPEEAIPASESMAGGEAALEGLDLDIDDEPAGFSTDEPEAFQSEPDMDLGGELPIDAGDDMEIPLDLEPEGGTGEDQFAEPEIGTDEISDNSEVLDAGDNFDLPLDGDETIQEDAFQMDEEVPAAAEPEFNESYDLEEEPQASPEGTTGDFQIELKNKEITCRAGEVVPVVAKATTSDGNPISAGSIIEFRIEEIPGSSAGAFFVVSSGMEGETVYTAEPDLSGEAASNIRVPDKTGEFYVNVSVGSVTEKITVRVAPGIPSSTKINASETELSGGQTVELIAYIEDKFGNPVPGEHISFEITDFKGDPGEVTQDSGQTNENGEFSTTYKASPNAGDEVTVLASNPNVGAFSAGSVMLMVVSEGLDEGTDSQQTESVEEGVAMEEIDLSTDSEMPLEMDLGTGMEQDVTLGEPSFELQEMEEPEAVSEAGLSEEPYEEEPAEEEEYYEQEEEESLPPAAPEMDEAYDEYLSEMEEEEDPYKAPVFVIKRGKRPVMEMSDLLPKIFKYGSIALCILLLAGLVIYGNKYARCSFHFNRALSRFTADDQIGALASFEKAKKFDYRKIESLKYIAMIHLNQAKKQTSKASNAKTEQSYNLALKALDEMLLIDPTNTEALYMEGQAYEGKNLYCNAMNKFQQILDGPDPNDQMAQAKVKELKSLCDDERSIKGSKKRGGTKR
ncbi:MAG TPA: tetratricopeptide repeat protein [bacterium]|nr:tetratricopeptide repeat protein [bacterium]